MRNLPRISDAEWEVMRVLWAGAPRTSAEIVDALATPQKWKPNTIKTLLQRLVKKGAIGAQAGARGYIYTPSVTEAQCVRAESKSFVTRVYGGGTLPLIANFLQQEKLSAEEIQHLRTMLDELEKKAK